MTLPLLSARGPRLQVGAQAPCHQSQLREFQLPEVLGQRLKGNLSRLCSPWCLSDRRLCLCQHLPPSSGAPFRGPGQGEGKKVRAGRAEMQAPFPSACTERTLCVRASDQVPLSSLGLSRTPGKGTSPAPLSPTPSCMRPSSKYMTSRLAAWHPGAGPRSLGRWVARAPRSGAATTQAALSAGTPASVQLAARPGLRSLCSGAAPRHLAGDAIYGLLR